MLRAFLGRRAGNLFHLIDLSYLSGIARSCVTGDSPQVLESWTSHLESSWLKQLKELYLSTFLISVDMISAAEKLVTKTWRQTRDEPLLKR